MASIVTVAQLRTILGVSSSLYDDAYLTDVIDTAEAVILPMLVAYQSGVQSYKVENNVAFIYTIRPHHFVEGQSVVIANVASALNGTKTVTDDHISEYVFTYSLTNADIEYRDVIPAGTATLSGSSAASLYVGNSAIESAVLNTSVEVFQSRTAAGNAVDGVDFQVSPYRMGRQLVQRISSLLAPFVDTDTIAQ
jgi:hypothetical protein